MYSTFVCYASCLASPKKRYSLNEVDAHCKPVIIFGCKRFWRLKKPFFIFFDNPLQFRQHSSSRSLITPPICYDTCSVHSDLLITRNIYAIMEFYVDHSASHFMRLCRKCTVITVITLSPTTAKGAQYMAVDLMRRERFLIVHGGDVNIMPQHSCRLLRLGFS